MAHTFTLAGTYKDAKNQPLFAGRYVTFRVTSVGTDTDDAVAYPRDPVGWLIDENGDFGGEMWINGESGTECLYEIIEPSGQRLKVLIPSAEEGKVVRYEYIVKNYQTEDSNQQSSILGEAKAYTDQEVAANSVTDQAYTDQEIGLTSVFFQSYVDQEIATCQPHSPNLDNFAFVGIELDLTSTHSAVGTSKAIIDYVEDKAKAHFILASSNNVTISTDVDNPTLISGFSNLKTYKVNFRASDGAIQNNAGRDLAGICGNIAMQINNIGGGTKTIKFWSEISSDGVNFTPISDSLRVRECASNNESFVSTVSFTDSWPQGSWIRFAFTAIGAVEFNSPSIVSDGNTINGRSIVWELTEQ